MRLVDSQVQRHVQALHDLYETRGFRFVELVAPSGSGKSRTVRELYRLLAARQSEPSYWPRLITEGHDVDPLAGRKVLGPPHTRVTAPPDAVPEYLWLSVCPAPRPDGSETSTLPQLVEQLDIHRVPLTVAALRRAGVRGELGWLRHQVVAAVKDVAKDEVKNAATGGAEQAFALLANITVPGASGAVGVAWRMLTRQQEQRKNLAAVAEGFELQLDHGELAERLRDQIAEVCSTGVRVVLTIEDGHLMDRGLARLLTALRDAAADVLVVSCVWPESTDREVYARLVHHLRTGDSVHGYSRVVFDPWTHAELRQLVLAEFPSTDAAVIDALVERFTSPLALLLVLSLQMVRDAAHDGRLEVPAAHIRSLSRDPEGLMRQRWNELDEPVKEALVLAMAMTGSQGFDDGLRFVREVVVAVGESTGKSVTSGLTDAVDRAQWLMQMLDGVDGYREPMLANVVLEEAAARFWPPQLADLAGEVWRELVLRVQQASRSATVSPGEELTARWLRALAPRVPEADAANVARACLVEARALSARHEATLALAVLEGAPVISLEQRLGLELQRVRYEALRDTGDLHGAVACGAELIEHMTSQLGAIAPDTLRVRLDVAHWRRTLGLLDAAVSDYRQLVDDLSMEAGATFEDIAVARMELLAATGYLGDAQEAELGLAELAAECRRELGETHPFTLRAERARWRWAGASRPADACVGLREVRERCVRALGEDHPVSLFTLSNLAYFTGRSGDHEAAKKLFGMCADGRRRVLGPTHPHTIDSIRNEAREAASLEGPAAAARRYERLVINELGVFELDNPLVLSTRLELATVLAEAGEVDECLAVLGELRERIGTAPTRTRILSTVGEYGLVDVTVDRLERLKGLLTDAALAEAHPVVDEWLSPLRSSLG